MDPVDVPLFPRCLGTQCQRVFEKVRHVSNKYILESGDVMANGKYEEPCAVV